MANSLYNLAAYSMVTGGFDWPDIPLVLSVLTGVPTFVSTHQKIGDIKAMGIVTEVTWMTIAGTQVPHDSSRLILFVDEAMELPFTPNGLDLLITPDWLAQRGWFRA